MPRIQRNGNHQTVKTGDRRGGWPGSRRPFSFVLAPPNRGCPMSRGFRDMGTITVSIMGFTPLALVSSTSELPGHYLAPLHFSQGISDRSAGVVLAETLGFYLQSPGQLKIKSPANQAGLYKLPVGTLSARYQVYSILLLLTVIFFRSTESPKICVVVHPTLNPAQRGVQVENAKKPHPPRRQNPNHRISCRPQPPSFVSPGHRAHQPLA